MRTPLLQLHNLSKAYPQPSGLSAAGPVYAVRSVTLDVFPGETLGIVGESGCGKSTLGRMAVGLLEPSSGDVIIKGQPLHDRTAHTDYRAFRRSLAGVLQMIFQDPFSSLNPRMRIGESIAEPLRCSTAWRNGSAGAGAALPGGSGAACANATDIKDRVAVFLRAVGLDAEAGRRFPHEFSGGQRQRIAIARALVTRPDIVVCDEPTSSLDASVQSQVLNLLRDMQDELGLTYCFISHDLAVVRHMSDRVAVMYRGYLVEEGEADAVFDAPLHPYTRLLLDSVPGLHARAFAREEGKEPPSVAVDPPCSQPETPSEAREGCPYASRCPEVMPVCTSSVPDLVAPAEHGGRRVRCRLFDQP